MIGQTVNKRYRVEALLGRGGMGAVYRATDLVAQRPVALKVLHHYLDGETEVALSRFHREFRVLMQLDHPGVVRAYEYGAYQAAPYLVLEYLAGRTLKETLEAGPLSRAQILYLARQISETLRHLHGRSIVHRDLKPGNLMLLSPDDSPRVKLMDFGLVRQVDVSLQLTQEGMALGTVTYMAPEQAQGLPVDFRADLYALGIMLYEMVTGRPPFVNEHPAMILMQHLATSPPPPRQFKPDLDEPLEQLILELLAKEPAQRPHSTDLLVSRLAELANETAPVLASAPNRAGLIPRVPLIGRQEILDDLTQHWRQAKQGQGQVVLLAGAAGVGKSRLLTEVSLQVQLDRGRFLTSHCRERVGLPYQPLVDLLEVLLDHLPASMREELPAELARLLPGAGAEVPDNMGLSDQAEARRRLFAACWELLRQAAQARPLMLELEDGQWADPATLDLVAYLADRLEQAPILLVLTYRPEEIEAEGAFKTLQRDLDRHENVHTITMELLSREQVAGFLKVALGQSNLPEWVVERFYQATDGNPLFIEETLKALAAEGQIAEWLHETSQTRWSTRSAASLPLPKNIISLAERRLQLVSAEDRSILTMAAVLGTEFSFALLEAVTGLDEDSLLDVIDRLLITRLIEELPWQNGEDRFRFAQEVLRQALFSTINQRRLRKLHRQTAEAMQNLYDTSQPRYWPLLAHHFIESGDEPQALKYSQLAGEAAARVYANIEAVAYYTQAIEIGRRGQAGSQELADLYTRRGRILELENHFDEALQNYQEMVDLADERGDKALNLASLTARCILRATQTPLYNPSRAKELGEAALVLARALGDRASEARVLWGLLLVEVWGAGDNHKALEYGQRSLSLARELDLKEQMGYTLTNLVNVYWNQDDMVAAREANLEARVVWLELGNTPMLADSYTMSQMVHWLAGEYDLLLAAAKEGGRISASIDNLWNKSAALGLAAIAYGEQGDFGQALANLEQELRLGMESQINSITVRAYRGLIRIYLAAGAFDQAERFADELYEQRSSIVFLYRALFLGLVAQAKVACNRLDQAQHILDEAYKGIKIEKQPVMRIGFPLLAEVYLALAVGQPEHALERAQYLARRAGRVGVRFYLPEALWLVGRSLLALKKSEQAHQVLLEAQTIAEKIGSRRVLWPILWELSQLEAAAGNSGEAERLRQHAKEVITYIADHIGSPELQASFLALPEVQSVITE